MKVHKGCAQLREKWGKCNYKNRKKWFVMEYIDPALLEGHKFDLRTYLLVASLNPLLIFYHDGFIRRAGTPYDADLTDPKAHITNSHSQDDVEDHFWDFKRLENYLHEKLGFPEDYITNNFRSHAIKVQNYVFQAARANMFKRKGAFQLFALDWIIDSKGGIHMLEANSNPLVADYEIPGFPETWHTMIDLLLQIHTEPETISKPLVTQPPKDRFVQDGWALIFNSQEEEILGKEYNACQALKELNKKPFAAPSEPLPLFDTEIVPEMPMVHEDQAKVIAEDPLITLSRIIDNSPARYDSKRFLSDQSFNCEKIEGSVIEEQVTVRCKLFANTAMETYFYVMEPVIEAKEHIPQVLVVSGVHGNEPSGVVAARHIRKILKLLNARLIVTERLNSQGVRKSQRYLNEKKLDPNRQFPEESELTSEFAKEVWRMVETIKPDVFFDFHEGWGLYTVLKENLPSNNKKLVGNKMFSKGSSIIHTPNAHVVAERTALKINSEDETGGLLRFLRKEMESSNRDSSKDVFLTSSPPIAGGLANKVAKSFGSMCFVQETTSRAANQPLQIRALQHIYLFVNTLKELNIYTANESRLKECALDESCYRSTESNWVLGETVDSCVAGRSNCKLEHPGDAVVRDTTVVEKEVSSSPVENIVSELEDFLADQTNSKIQS